MASLFHIVSRCRRAAQRHVRPLRTVKLSRSTLCVLLAVTVFVSGCTFLLHPISSTFARHSDPLEGWKALGSACVVSCPFPTPVVSDYRNYIAKLPADERQSVGDFAIRFF